MWRNWIGELLGGGWVKTRLWRWKLGKTVNCPGGGTQLTGEFNSECDEITPWCYITWKNWWNSNLQNYEQWNTYMYDRWGKKVWKSNELSWLTNFTMNLFSFPISLECWRILENYRNIIQSVFYKYIIHEKSRNKVVRVSSKKHSNWKENL